MASPATIARALSAAFLAGDLEVDELIDRGGRAMEKRWRWLRPLARRVVERFAGTARPRQIVLIRFLLSDDGFRRACERHDLRLDHVVSGPPPVMRPIGAAESWRLPPIRNVSELADWLDITIGELEWFADTRLLEYKSHRGRLRHYHYRPLMKRFGHVRLIESPKLRLKHIQRRILAGILDRVPPHAAAHGFRRGRSIATFAAPHVAKKIVVRIDLHDFFPSISLARVRAFFRTVGYPDKVADLLAGLCTNATPLDVWEQAGVESPGSQLRENRWLYSQPHLPQGAPTSPALANLCAYRLDCRLSSLARSAGATYTRYADDLAFSGQRDFDRVAERFQLHVCATVMEERFFVHYRKTRIMRRGVRQHLAGLVVNERLNVSRDDFDRLKATLTNCLRRGPASQNRRGHQNYRGHLEGRITFIEMVNPAKGLRLRKLFDQIVW